MRNLPLSRQGLVLCTFTALLLVLAWDLSGLDVEAARLMGGYGAFPLREHWLLTRVLHQGALLVSWALVGWITIGVWYPTLALRRLDRMTRIRWALATWLPVLVVNLMKLASDTSCPWDLAQFGGTAVHVSHWAWGVFDGGSAHCFPAGHASAGFVFIAGYFAWLDHDPKMARRWLLGGLLAGGVLGLSQQLRGAHYASHTLWTAWLCWSIAWLVDALQVVFARRWMAARASWSLVLFWTITVLAATFGETGGDAVSGTLRLGHAGASLVFLGVFAATLAAQRLGLGVGMTRYWLPMLAATLAGTTVADFLIDTLALGPGIAATLLGVSLAFVFAGRQHHGRRGSGASGSAPATSFWSAILLANALGVALADCVAASSGLGLAGGATLFAGLFATAGVLHVRCRAFAPGMLFWLAYVLARPLGASLGDTLTDGGFVAGWAADPLQLSLAMAALLAAGITLMARLQERRGARPV